MSLYFACCHGDVELAEQLIADEVDVNWRNPLIVSNICTYITAEVMQIFCDLLCLVHSYDLHDPW